MKPSFSMLVITGLVLLSSCGPSKKENDVFEAIYAGNKARVVELVQTGLDINFKDDEGSSLLITAAWHGKEDIVQWLLDNGAAPDQKDNYYKTALIYAADQGHAHVVKLLLEHGADIHYVDTLSNWKALDYAAARDHEDVVNVILDIKGNELTQLDRKSASEKTKNTTIKKLLSRRC